MMITAEVTHTGAALTHMAGKGKEAQRARQEAVESSSGETGLPSGRRGGSVQALLTKNCKRGMKAGTLRLPKLRSIEMLHLLKAMTCHMA